MSLRLLAEAADTPATPITIDALTQYFHRCGKPRAAWRVGAEIELIAVSGASGRQLPYLTASGVEALLERRAADFAWSVHREDGHVVALTRETTAPGAVAADRSGRYVISLEPGAQIELATPPVTHLATLAAALAQHRAELRAVAGTSATEYLGIGFTPFSSEPDIGMTTRARHRIMAAYLPTRGNLALSMMKGTASVQVAVDYSDEADACKKLWCALCLSPLCTALFANSPIAGGRDTGMASYRGHIWLNTDPDRAGLLGDVVEEGAFSFARWTEFLLDVPMMFYAVGDQWEPALGRTFRDYMRAGLRGTMPTLDDWETHLTSVFPEVRLKQYIEIRGADSVPLPMAAGVPALWKGVMYDDAALAQAQGLARELSRDRAALFHLAIHQGLRGVHRGRSLGQWVRELLAISARGLANQSVATGLEDERALLEPLLAAAEAERSPAEQIRERCRNGVIEPAAVLELCRF